MSLWLPVLIAAVCIAVIVVVHLLTRQGPSVQDIALPERPGDRSPPTASLSPADLAAWHRGHEHELLALIEEHDRAVSVDSVDVVADGAGLDDALAAHPDPVARGELSALLAAAAGTSRALARGDHEAARVQHETYLRYRRLWMERLWQFRQDHARVGRLQHDPEPHLPAASVRSAESAGDGTEPPRP